MAAPSPNGPGSFVPGPLFGTSGASGASGGANIDSEDGNAGRKANEEDENSSQGSQQSPSLSPSQNHPMTNSIISNLDLGEEDRGIGGSGSNVRNEMVEDHSNPFLDHGSNGRAMPLAPQDVLSQSNSYSTLNQPNSSFNFSPLASRHSQDGSGSNAPIGADDSALDALVEAHQKQDSRFDSPFSRNDQQGDQSSILSPSRRHDDSVPSTRDASFGLDPDADTSHSLQGTPFRMAASSSSSGRQHHHPHHASHSRSIYDEEEVHAPSHTTAASGAPETMKTNSSHTQTVPTASATGMPRFLPRRTSHSGSDSQHSSRSSEAPAPKEMQPNYPPSGSLTIAIFAKNIGWRRRGYLLLASFAINLGLPFINGVMLGFGEIFARTIVAPWIGLAPGAININAPGPQRGNTGGAGLRYAGVGESRGVGGGHVSVESWEVEPGKKGRGQGKL